MDEPDEFSTADPDQMAPDELKEAYLDLYHRLEELKPNYKALSDGYTELSTELRDMYRGLVYQRIARLITEHDEFGLTANLHGKRVDVDNGIRDALDRGNIRNPANIDHIEIIDRLDSTNSRKRYKLRLE